MGSAVRGIALTRIAVAISVAISVAMAAAASPPVVAGADAARPFVGSYTVVSPERTTIWIVTSTCAFLGCTAVIAGASQPSFDMLFDGTQWGRLAVPHTGTCHGATVPASAAAEVLVPRGDGSLTGSMTTTVQCDGAPLTVSLPLTVTPMRA